MALLVVIATWLAACSSTAPENDAARTQTAKPPQPEQTQRSPDEQFVAELAEHYRHGVLMFERAEVRATDPGVREMASRVHRDETRELARLHHWLANAGVRWDAPADPHTAPEDLETARGPAFDRALLEAIIKHHQHAIDLAKRALPKLRDVRSQAEEAIRHHEREIAEISQLAVHKEGS